MSDPSELHQIVLEAVDEFNRGQIEAERIRSDSEVVLVGEGGQLDSMGLVTLIIAVEQKVQQQFGRAVALADEKAFSQKHSPFRTLDTLTAYIGARLAETTDG